jgi:hypothetical protein
VTPDFGVRIVSTPVILGRGGVDWPCAKGARTVAKATSGKDIAMFIVTLLLILHVASFDGTTRYHHATLDVREEKRLRARITIMVLWGTKFDGRA